ncbi:MAG: hypothetical protein IKV94_02075 [Clostridia bacterium]|nr:hypothetical protein [Clostridia bacterium]
MEQYKEGTVFALYENSDQEYIILKNVKSEEGIYLVVSPVLGDVNNLKLDASKSMLLKVDPQTNDITFVKDENIIRSIVDNIFED